MAYLTASPHICTKKVPSILKLCHCNEESYTSQRRPAIGRSRMPSSRQFNMHFMGDKSIAALSGSFLQKWNTELLWQDSSFQEGVWGRWIEVKLQGTIILGTVGKYPNLAPTPRVQGAEFRPPPGDWVIISFKPDCDGRNWRFNSR